MLPNQYTDMLLVFLLHDNLTRRRILVTYFAVARHVCEHIINIARTLSAIRRTPFSYHSFESVLFQPRC